MNLWESIAVALEGLLANKMRSVLTALGIIIGVAAVITMLAIAGGAKKQMMTNIEGIGTNVLMIFQRRGEDSTRTQPLSLKDVAAIEAECPSVLRVAPEVRANATVKYRNEDSTSTITGVTDVYDNVRNYKLAEGHFFTESDVNALRKVAVLGSQVAIDLFDGAPAIGEYIRINGTRFRVIGVMQSKGSGGFGNADDQVFIPLTTAMRRLFGLDELAMISVQASEMRLMDAAKAEVEAALRKTHKLKEGDELDFNVSNQADILAFANTASGIFTALLAGIASVSLLVGGIGIMNIMLVSVTERTREIGIRMALGARRRDIQTQFLVEALVLSLLGGFIGILLGIGLSAIAAVLIKWEFAISLSAIFIAFSFAAGVGIFFGFYPARKASRMDPIEALRYE